MAGEQSALTATWFAKVQSHQLHHIRFQKVHIPPRQPLRLRQRTRVDVEKRTGAAIDGFLRNASRFGAYLHRSLPSRDIQH